MERIHFFILICIAGVIGSVITLVFSQNWACMVATIILIPGLALTVERWFRDRQELREKLYSEMMMKENALKEFIQMFDIERNRAEILYNSGFRKIDDLRGKTVQDLMQIDNINPTLAKQIVQKMETI